TDPRPQPPGARLRRTETDPDRAPGPRRGTRRLRRLGGRGLRGTRVHLRPLPWRRAAQPAHGRHQPGPDATLRSGRDPGDDARAPRPDRPAAAAKGGLTVT